MKEFIPLRLNGKFNNRLFCVDDRRIFGEFGDRGKGKKDGKIFALKRFDVTLSMMEDEKFIFYRTR